MEHAGWTVHVIEFARTEPFPWVNLLNGMPPQDLVELPFSFVLAERGDRKVLVDTGFMQEGSREAYPNKFGIPGWVSPVRMLGEIGIAPGAITDIFVTHAHFDHMGSISQYPNAQIHIQKSELLSWHEAMALPRQFGHIRRNLDPDDLRAAFDAAVEHRLTLLDGDRDNVLPGIHVRLGPGHTPGQQFVVLETERGRLVVSGDCVYSRRNFHGHQHDGVYVPLNNTDGSVWDQLKTIDKMNSELAGDMDKLIIIHDTERWPGLPVVKEVEGFRIVKAT